MNDVPDFEKLQEEFAKLKKHGYDLQARGIDIVKIAESGASNVATYSSVFSISVPVAKNDKILQQKLDALAESGRYTSEAVAKTNGYLTGINAQLAAIGTETLTGVTFSNMAAFDIISYAASIAPGEQKRGLAALSKKSLSRPFNDEDLDALLLRFREDLPSRRAGAWDAFHSVSADALAQASHTMRDILAVIIAKEAGNKMIEQCAWYCERKKEQPNTKPNTSDRIRYLLFGLSNQEIDQAELGMTARAVSEYVDDDGALKNTAHGSHQFTRAQIKLSLERIEELLYLVLRKLEERKDG